MMNAEMTYTDFAKINGVSLSEINTGSEEVAFNYDDANKALKILENENIAITGGDILTKNDNGLIYAYQEWGEEFSCLNWYCEKLKNEDYGEYQKRSIEVAKKGIENAHKIAVSKNQICLIVFVVD